MFLWQYFNVNVTKYSCIRLRLNRMTTVRFACALGWVWNSFLSQQMDLCFLVVLLFEVLFIYLVHILVWTNHLFQLVPDHCHSVHTETAEESSRERKSEYIFIFVCVIYMCTNAGVKSQRKGKKACTGSYFSCKMNYTWGKVPSLPAFVHPLRILKKNIFHFSALKSSSIYLRKCIGVLSPQYLN